MWRLTQRKICQKTDYQVMVMVNYERINLRKYLGLAAVAALILSLTACASDTTESTGSGDSLSGTELTVYSGRSEEFIGPFFADFEAATGINLNVRYGDSAELAAQLLEEGDNSPADIFISQDAGSLGAVAEAGMLTALDDDVLQLVPAEYEATSGLWIGLTGRARVFAYDPIKVTELPTSIDDLLDPKWNGKIGIAPTNASFQGFVTALRQLRGEVSGQLCGRRPQQRRRWARRPVGCGPRWTATGAELEHHQGLGVGLGFEFEQVGAAAAAVVPCAVVQHQPFAALAKDTRQLRLQSGVVGQARLLDQAPSVADRRGRQRL